MLYRRHLLVLAALLVSACARPSAQRASSPVLPTAIQPPPVRSADPAAEPVGMAPARASLELAAEVLGAPEPPPKPAPEPKVHIPPYVPLEETFGSSAYPRPRRSYASYGRYAAGPGPATGTVAPGIGTRSVQRRPRSVSSEEGLLGAARPRLAALRACYEDRLQGEPKLSGTLVIHATIAADGKVAWVRVDQPLDPVVDACVVELFQRVTFPQREDGLMEAVRFTLRFAPATAAAVLALAALLGGPAMAKNRRLPATCHGQVTCICTLLAVATHLVSRRGRASSWGSRAARCGLWLAPAETEQMARADTTSELILIDAAVSAPGGPQRSSPDNG